MRSDNINIQMPLPLKITGPISEKEKEIILANLDKTNGMIAKMLNRTEGSVRNFLTKNGIKRTPEQIASTKLIAGSKTRGEANGNYKHGDSGNNYRYKLESIRKHPKRHRARVLFNSAVRHGKIKRKEFCERCGSDNKVEAHHANYNKPYDVEFLCKSCHFVADLDRVEAEIDAAIKNGIPLGGQF